MVNCTKCSSGTICEACNDNFLDPTTDKCETSCPDTYYKKVSTHTCDKCDTINLFENCYTCVETGTSCTECKPFYYLSLDYKTCLKNCTILGCLFFLN